jgi:hypothetical protein
VNKIENMTLKKIVVLPGSGAGCGDAQVIASPPDLKVEFEYSADGKDFIGALMFFGVIAYRFRNEMHSQGYINESYDAVIEVSNSVWLRDIAQEEPKGVRGASEAKHFAVLISNNGYLEVIGNEVQLEAPREGSLS